ncbi:MAG: hypothetical protein IJ228_00715 [Succinivibrio sp.]|nr:hypothetical protein [Succinivibrio sp.]
MRYKYRAMIDKALGALHKAAPGAWHFLVELFFSAFSQYGCITLLISCVFWMTTLNFVELRGIREKLAEIRQQAELANKATRVQMEALNTLLESINKSQHPSLKNVELVQLEHNSNEKF